MKSINILIAIGSAAFISSCANTDPEYKKYKLEKAAQEQAAQAALENNPYGAPQIPDAGTVNPYAVPGQPSSPSIGSSVPYQQLPPIPGVGGTSNNPLQVNNTPNMNIPANGMPTQNFTNTISHTVVAGDTIWGLSKKYNVTQSDITAANGLSDSKILLGQQLQIPQP